jgi:CoA:oxalate CoA-transferase
MFAAIGLQAALVERQRTGRGRHVDVAMLDGQVSLLENALARCQLDGRVPGPIGSRHPSVTPFGVFRASDASLVLAAGNDGIFVKLCDTIGIAQAKDEPRFKSNALRCQHHAELKALIERSLSTATVAEWLVRLKERGIPCGPMNDVESVLRDPHVQARGMLMDWPLADGRTLATAGCPIQFGDGPLTRAEPAPRLDQHRAELLRELGLA